MNLSDIWSKYVTPALTAAQASGVLLAGVGLCFTAVQIGDSRKVEAEKFALQFDDKLAKPELVTLVYDASAEPPEKVLVKNGGKSSDQTLSLLLGSYDTLYYLYEDHLITDRLLNDIFCGDIIEVFSNAEIQAELRGERSDAGNDADIFNGFDRLAQRCMTWKKNGRSHKLAD